MAYFANTICCLMAGVAHLSGFSYEYFNCYTLEIKTTLFYVSAIYFNCSCCSTCYIRLENMVNLDLFDLTSNICLQEN